MENAGSQVSGIPRIFESEHAKVHQQAKEYESEKEELYKQIGKLTTQIEWLKKNLVSDFCRSERMTMVDSHLKGIPVSVQASLLEINRTGLYYKSQEPSQNDIAVKAAIDRIYTIHPEFGYRRVTAWLNKYEGMCINHKATLRHMQEMGVRAVYPRQNTSRPNPANKVYPYLLKGLIIDHPNHVWSIDITYIPIRRSWLYLVTRQAFFVVSLHLHYLCESTVEIKTD